MGRRMLGVVVGAAALVGCVGGLDAGLADEAARAGEGDVPRDVIDNPAPTPGHEEIYVGCRVTAGGQIEVSPAGRDAFGGNAQPFRDGSVDGEWNHVDAEGDHFHGDPTWMQCGYVEDGAWADVVWLGGVGTWNGEGGYSFYVMLEDRGEPGRDDTYHLEVWAADGTIVYANGSVLARGNVQYHALDRGHP